MYYDLTVQRLRTKPVKPPAALDEVVESPLDSLVCLRPPLQGDIDIQYFKQAWDHIILRHHIFRTAFVDQDCKQLLQIVVEEITLPWYEADWCELSSEQQKIVV